MHNDLTLHISTTSWWYFCFPYSRKVWRIDSFREFGKKKFGVLIDEPKLIVSIYLDGFWMIRQIRQIR